jgi:hypothetical protein
LALTIFNLLSVGVDAAAWSPGTTKVFVETIGYVAPDLSSACLSTRNPITEWSCLTDIPGGYCTHFGCGMVNPLGVYGFK